MIVWALQIAKNTNLLICVSKRIKLPLQSKIQDHVTKSAGESEDCVSK